MGAAFRCDFTNELRGGRPVRAGNFRLREDLGLRFSLQVRRGRVVEGGDMTPEFVDRVCKALKSEFGEFEETMVIEKQKVEG